MVSRWRKAVRHQLTNDRMLSGIVVTWIGFQNRECFDHDKGLRPRVIIRQRDVDNRFVSRGGHRLKPFFCPTCHVHLGLPCSEVCDRHILPCDAHGEACAQGFGACFLGCPAFGVGASHITPSLCLVLFYLGENAVAEPIPKAVKRPLYAIDIRKVCTDAQNHGDGYPVWLLASSS